MQNKIPFPEVLDSTMRASFIACEQKFFREFIEGRVPRGTSIHLHAGSAFASGVEHTLNAFHQSHMTDDDALAHGIIEFTKSWGHYEPTAIETTKTYERMLGALVDYFTEYPLGQDYLIPISTPYKSGVEFTFALPLDIKHPTTGQPIIYAGRFDRIAQWNDMIVIADDKTTTQLGAQWYKQWRLRAQFTGYVWAARQFGFDVQGIVIRGVSILKEKYGHVQVVEQRPQWEIDRWYYQLHLDINRMIQCWTNNYWGYALDKACADFNGCPFLDACSSPNPDKWLEVGFTRRSYTPLGKVISEEIPNGGGQVP